MNRSSLFKLKAYKKTFKRTAAVMAAAVLIVTMLAGCKQGESAVQAAENGTTVQAAESAEYAVRDVKIFDGEPTDRTIPLRFYKEAPHVAYMGIRDYFDLMLGGGLTVADHGDGTFTLTNAKGAEADVDTVQGIVTMENMPAFDNYLEDAKAGVQSSFKDSPAPYLRLRDRDLR